MIFNEILFRFFNKILEIYNLLVYIIFVSDLERRRMNVRNTRYRKEKSKNRKS